MPAEVMSAGPRRVPVRLLRVISVGAAAAVLLAAASFSGLRIYRARTDLVSLAELHAAYAAFLTPDGRNQVTDLLPAPAGSPAITVSPAVCSPLIEIAFDARFPPTAQQGVSTFQGGGFGYSVSLFSFRFADRADAEAEFDRLRQAAADCDRRRVEVGTPFSSRLEVSILPTVVPQTDATLDLLLRQDATRAYQETVVRDKNVLSWQYTYRSGASVTPEHGLLAGLSSRLRSVDRVGG